MLAGTVGICMGISIFKLAMLGNDAYNAMGLAVSAKLGISYGSFVAGVSIALFVIQLIFGRKYIGIGTIVNAFFQGYIAAFFMNLWAKLGFSPELFGQKLLVMLIGVVFCCFGISLYQSADVGIAPYDSMSLIMADRFPKIPYFWCRISNDVACALICYFAGGLIGLGTLVAAGGLGPVTQFFTTHITKKYLLPDEV